MMNSISVLPSRSALLELVARADAEPESDEAHFLGQLRAAISEFEGTRARGPRPGLRLVYSAE